MKNRKTIKYPKDNKNIDRRRIYILLSQTNTYPARAIHFYTKEPYAHASIAFDENLEEMYSFARRGLYNPFNAGFIREHIDSGVFARFSSTTCCVYELQITNKQYYNLRQEINVFIENKDSYSYNYLGLLGAAFNIPIKSKQRYFCSQFVAYLLQQSEINIFNKDYSLIKPRDIRVNPYLKPIYQGKLAEYRIYKRKFKMA
ncbi:MAG: hypothetical protein GX321_10220 [Clostridiales bacterium]|nr:hypothetical protein [Clostridiales bacterium]